MMTCHKNLNKVRIISASIYPSGNQFCLPYIHALRAYKNEAIINHKILSKPINLCTCILALITHSRNPINRAAKWMCSSRREEVIKEMHKKSIQRQSKQLSNAQRFNFSQFFFQNKQVVERLKAD